MPTVLRRRYDLMFTVSDDAFVALAAAEQLIRAHGQLGVAR